jgi:hypothetical protein
LFQELSSKTFAPPDLIVAKPKRRRQMRQWPLILLALASAGVVALWKREVIIEKVEDLVEKLQEQFTNHTSQDFL